MADIKVEDLMRSIREGARESVTSPAGPSLSLRNSAEKPLARLETSLTITGRTHDQLPPVTTYRTGLPARLELWIKRQLKRATHWYTWEQVNFNSAVNSTLHNMLTLLRAYEQRLASLQSELDASLASQANLESQLIELQSSRALIETQIDGRLAEKIVELRSEHQKVIDLLLNEQRVCFKQLELEISEAGVIADRAKRSIQLRLEELAARVDKMNAERPEVKTAGRV